MRSMNAGNDPSFARLRISTNAGMYTQTKTAIPLLRKNATMSCFGASVNGIIGSGSGSGGTIVSSMARIRSSSIGAAASGRSAMVKSQAHLYFDELENGPNASSSLAGTVCVTGNSTVDTDNSSTVLNVVTTCGT